MITVEQFFEMEQTVLNWNETFGNKLDDSSLIKLYQGLCLEEAKEGRDAKTTEEEIDAIGDSIFVGMMLNRLVEGVGYIEERSFIEESKENYQTFDENKVRVHWEQMCKALVEEDNYTYTSYLVGLIFLLGLKYDVYGAFKRIAESNFSKAISSDQEPLLNDHIEEVQKKGRYGEVFAEKVGEYFLIKAKVDLQEEKTYDKAKIVKGSWYNSVEDLGGLSEFIK